jgi:hypothetical protein
MAVPLANPVNFAVPPQPVVGVPPGVAVIRQVVVAPPLFTVKLTVTVPTAALVLVILTVGLSIGTTALLRGLDELALPAVSTATTVNV